MNTANFPRNKKRKQDEAKQRQAYWSSLSPKKQLEILDTRPGQSLRQRARIQKAIEITKAAK